MRGVLLVIPCLNEAATLPDLLRRLLAESGDAPVVVADGGSTDGSREIAARFAAADGRVRLLDNPRRVQSAGINAAVRAHGAGARWLVRVDAHCDYPPDYARRLVAVAEGKGASCVTVPMVSRGRGCFQVAAAAAQNSVLGTGGSPHRHVGRGKWVDHGHHALMDLSLFERVGGYREDMAANEDAELDLRLGRAGARIWLEPSLALVYHPRRSVGALWRQYMAYGRGRARTLRLHGMRPKPRQALPLLVPLAGALALGAPIQPVLAAPLAGWALLCLGGGLVVGARAGGGCALGSGAAAAVMHMAWGLGFLRQFPLTR